MKNEKELLSIKEQVMESLKAGKPWFGEDGALAPLIQNIVNSILEGEMDAHLTQESRESGNRRNGKMEKQLQTPVGEVTVSTPRDRDASFSPQFLKKRETVLSESMAESIISLYARGTSTRDISKFMEETLGTSVSADMISSITDRIMPELEAWRTRPLDEVYPIVFMDAVHFKVIDDHNRAETRAIYNVLGIDKEGRKDILGMYVSHSEGANFWLSVITDLHNRGVQDIMIACVDGLKGFPDAIHSVFPNTDVQLCIIHQIRNTMKYVTSKDKKAVMNDLKPVYQAINKDAANSALCEFDAKWGKKYPIVVKSWNDNWNNLTTYFQYTDYIRKIIYTTNTVEGYHRQIRKVTKNKGVFPNDNALKKIVYLAYRNVRKKWTVPVPNWGLISQQFAITFGERYPI